MSEHVGRFRMIIASQLGLAFDDAKLDFLGEVLRRRGGADPITYLARLSAGSSDELGKLAEELTVGETYFFRHREQITAIAEVALRDRIRARASSKRLRILSAGCATGEEPYTLAILAREVVTEPGWTVSIRGVDVNPAALERAVAGRFTPWSLRETPPEVQRAWFRVSGREVVLDDSVRAQVQFEQKNLASEDPELWQPSSYDIVLCRNVLMYFAPEVARRIVVRIERALVPGGYLFLGHAETLRGLSQSFHLCHTHGTFYYQRRDDGDAQAQPAPPQATAVVVQEVERSTTWVEAIRRAADRIRVLSEQASAPAPATSVQRTQHEALRLLEHERFDDALALLDANRPTDADALLLHAILLVHRARLADAEACCRALLALDELDAGAHYVLALCREVSGDRDGAIEHNGIAAYLDPTFAMPRLQLGLLARRTGDIDTARRELAQALLLLQREDASRVLLFGGGFRRDALIALCRAELQRVEGRA